MQKLLNSFYGKMIGLLLSFFLFSNASQAQCRLLNENFDIAPVLSSTNVDGTWYPDRYRPAAFVSDVLAGNNVLKISIDGTNDGLLSRPAAYQYTFYNTQGRKFNQCGSCVTISKGDVYIPADWETKHRRTDMWATAFDASNSISAYPIIGFRNPDGASPGIYYWDENIGWINSGIAVVYDSWYTLEFRLVGPNIEYYVNGVNVGSITSNSSTYLGNIIMQAYNFNDPTLPAINQSEDSYDAYWDNLKTTGPGGNFVTDITTGQTFCSIQGAIDAANPGDYIQVHAGNYFEKATNRFVFGTNGPHKFGLFIDKDNLTIEGLDAFDNPVTNAADAAVVVTTNATNNFGSSGIFVQANGVTLKGLKIGDNYNDANIRDNNKTIEVVGDAFNMNHCWVSTALDEGAFYMGRWDASHPIASYTLTQNKFENTLVSINNGVGLTGLRAGRLITNNEFTGVATPYLIGFRGWNGAGPVQGWIVDPVGGAVVTGNAFNTTGVDKYVVARGNAGGYINSELDWAEIWNLNTYGNHVVTLTDYPSFDVRTYTDGAGYPETRRISPPIQDNIGISQTGDVVLVGAGTYNESVLVNKEITLLGAQAGICAKGRAGAESVVDPNSSASHGFKIVADNVTIDGFTITNSAAYPGSERYGIVTIEKIGAGNFTNIKALNNIIKRQFNAVSFNYTNNFEISCNWLNGESDAYNNAGVWISSYGTTSTNGLIKNNDIDGYTGVISIHGSTAEPVSSLNITENRSVYGQYVLIGLQNSAVYRNTATNVTVGSHVFISGGSSNDLISENFFDNGSGNGIRVSDAFNGLGINSNITVTHNSITGHPNPNFEINVTASAYSGSLAATCNWYGSNVPATVAGKIFGAVTYIPYLTSGVDAAPSTPGFQTAEVCAACPASCIITVNPSPTVAGHAPNTIYRGYGPSSVMLTASAGVSYLWSTGATTQSITVSPTATTTYTVTVKYANGCTSTCSITIAVIDVRCGKKNDKVTICHNGHEICVSPNAVPAHLAHGDRLGACPSNLVSVPGLLPEDEKSIDKEKEFKVIISPNPAMNVFNIQVNSESREPINIRIMDATGMVKSTLTNITSGSKVTTGSNLRGGTYYAEITQGNNRQVVRLVKLN